MEIISAVLLALSPWIIKAITNLVKKAQTVKFSGGKVTIIRFVVAVLSFLTALGTSVLSGEELDGNVISTLAESLIVFLGATGAYFFEKLKKGQVE